MKATLACAALAAGVSAGSLHHKHNQAKRDYEADTTFSEPDAACGCTTVYTTIYGEPTLIFPTVPAQAAPTTSTKVEATVPTPIPQTISSTGVYTFPATTITLTQDTTVPVPCETSVPAGTHTLGGVTTTVTGATTVTCPYATVSTTEGTVTSVIESTTYVCPSAGTYTIAPTTTVVPSATTVTFPTVTSFPAGTYTQPEVVTTIFETSTVVYCPFAVPTPSGGAVSSTPVEGVPSTPVGSVPTTPAGDVPTAPAGSVPAPSGVPGKPWAVTYTPYLTSAGGGCKSLDEVNHDIAAIAAAGITTVRVYSTDCSTLEFVGSACEAHDVKMILGIYIDQPGCHAGNPPVTDQLSAIKNWAKWDLVDMITVGNEAVESGFCTPAELASLISTAKQELSYPGPYTTAETVNIWQEQEFIDAICPVVDMVGANAHAFFNPLTTADQAGPFVKSQLDIIDGCCAGKEGRIMETGWPSAGLALGLAIPGFDQQAEAVKSIIEYVGNKAVLFSLTSDGWKSSNTECQCEQHWGCASILGIDL
ncbi:glycoside hydrolase family 17 protein [Xylaria nigripes]|nr:glycoside hydrolase family 17 protein [Xylaria nigripes]